MQVLTEKADAADKKCADAEMALRRVQDELQEVCLSYSYLCYVEYISEYRMSSVHHMNYC